MSDKRMVILVPSDRDNQPGQEEYFRNFVWRVAHALANEGLEYSMQVVPVSAESKAIAAESAKADAPIFIQGVSR